MNLNTITYNQQRRRFGRQVIFNDRNQMLFDEPARHEDFAKLYILRNPAHKFTQLSKQFGLSEVLTENPSMVHHGLFHTEGGWPKDVNYLDEEAATRHRKKSEREDSYGKELMNCTKPVIASVLQNNAVNIYQDYFTELDPISLKQKFSAVNTNIFHDIIKPERPIFNLNWSPSEPTKILSVHSTYDQFPTNDIQSDFYIWDTNNQLSPFNTFTSPFITTVAQYCPRDDNLIAGGLKSGMACVWDSRKGGVPVNICPLEAAHRDQVSALCWVHSKSNTEFYTGSPDGTVRYWDGRNLRVPTQKYYLDPVRSNTQEPSRAHGVSTLQFEYTIPVRYIVGTEHGQMFLANRKGMSAVETLAANYRVFNGPVLSIERHPFFTKNLLIVGEWCVKIWTEDCKDYPITRYANQKTKLNCAAWSPTRTSTFFTGSQAGKLDFWDVVLDQKEPIFTMGQFNSPITALCPKSTGDLIAVGTANGDIFMIQLEDGFVKGPTKDKAIVSAALERELHRCKLLEGRVREIRLNAAKMNTPLILETEVPGEAEDDVDDADVVPDLGFEAFGSASDVADGADGGAAAVEEVKPEEEEIEEVDMEEEDPDPELTETRIYFDTIYEEALEKNKEKMFILEKCAFDSKNWVPEYTFEEEEGEEEEGTT